MPTYEYQCDKCGVFEITQRITENALKRCPTCKGKVERIISQTSFVLKGSGWYATDYARSSKSESKGESATGEGASANASSTNGSSAASDSPKPASTAGSDQGSTSKGSEKSVAAKSAD
jgi:putative FmdB family regulatory protein